MGWEDGCQQYASKRGTAFSLHLVQLNVYLYLINMVHVRGVLIGTGQAYVSFPLGCRSDNSMLFPISTRCSEEGILQKKREDEKECGANKNSYHGLLEKLRVRVKRLS